MARLSTTAWVLHDLGLAAGFGGNLFGQLALNPAVAAAESKRDRGRVAQVAWSRYKGVNAFSLLAFAGTWAIGRALLSGREVGRTSRKITVMKDGLVAGAVITGLGSMIAGTMLSRARERADEAPIETGAHPAPETPREVARLQRITSVFGIATIVLEAAAVATTTVLAMTSGRSTKWSFAARYLLP
jgi:hypothetical protein